MSVPLAALAGLGPALAVAGGALVLLVLTALRVRHGVVWSAGLGALALGLVASLPAGGAAPWSVGPLLAVDGFSLLFARFSLVATLVVMLIARGDLERRDEPPGELYVLLLVGALGACVLAGSTHLASAFLGLELLSVPLYAAVAYPRGRPESVEAGIQYLVLAASSSAFLLFGMALLYAERGAMDLVSLAAAAGGGSAAWRAAGLALVLVGAGFKLGLVPFHMWSPGVYQGAPAPVAAFLATVSRGAVLALLLRWLEAAGGSGHPSLAPSLSALAVASMLVGTGLALRQTSLKRVLAYSSIAHFGFLLVALRAAGPLGVRSAVFYLVGYALATLAAFGVIGLLSAGDRDRDRIAEFRGLYWQRPGAAVVLTLSLLSLGGLPLTAGFVGKLHLAAAAFGAELWLPLAALVVASVAGLYYYLGVAAALFAEPGGNALPAPRAGNRPARAALAAVALLTVWLGVQPSGLLEEAARAGRALGPPPERIGAAAPSPPDRRLSGTPPRGRPEPGARRAAAAGGEG